MSQRSRRLLAAAVVAYVGFAIASSPQLVGGAVLLVIAGVGLVTLLGRRRPSGGPASKLLRRMSFRELRMRPWATAAVVGLVAVAAGVSHHAIFDIQRRADETKNAWGTADAVFVGRDLVLRDAHDPSTVTKVRANTGRWEPTRDAASQARERWHVGGTGSEVSGVDVGLHHVAGKTESWVAVTVADPEFLADLEVVATVSGRLPENATEVVAVISGLGTGQGPGVGSTVRLGTDGEGVRVVGTVRSSLLDLAGRGRVTEIAPAASPSQIRVVLGLPQLAARIVDRAPDVHDVDPLSARRLGTPVASVALGRVNHGPAEYTIDEPSRPKILQQRFGLGCKAACDSTDPMVVPWFGIAFAVSLVVLAVSAVTRRRCRELAVAYVNGAADVQVRKPFLVQSVCILLAGVVLGVGSSAIVNRAHFSDPGFLWATLRSALTVIAPYPVLAFWPAALLGLDRMIRAVDQSAITRPRPAALGAVDRRVASIAAGVERRLRRRSAEVRLGFRSAIRNPAGFALIAVGLLAGLPLLFPGSVHLEKAIAPSMHPGDDVSIQATPGRPWGGGDLLPGWDHSLEDLIDGGGLGRVRLRGALDLCASNAGKLTGPMGLWRVRAERGRGCFEADVEVLGPEVVAGLPASIGEGLGRGLAVPVPVGHMAALPADAEIVLPSGLAETAATAPTFEEAKQAGRDLVGGDLGAGLAGSDEFEPLVLLRSTDAVRLGLRPAAVSYLTVGLERSRVEDHLRDAGIDVSSHYQVPSDVLPWAGAATESSDGGAWRAFAFSAVVLLIVGLVTAISRSEGTEERVTFQRMGAGPGRLAKVSAVEAASFVMLPLVPAMVVWVGVPALFAAGFELAGRLGLTGMRRELWIDLPKVLTLGIALPIATVVVFALVGVVEWYRRERGFRSGSGLMGDGGLGRLS